MLNEKTIVEKLSEYNKAYRDGNPIVSDKEYDELLDKLPEEHWYRNKVEPEEEIGETFKHPIPMLSTQKAKTDEEVLKWINKIENCADQYMMTVDASKVDIRVTAKLDGMAARFYETGELVTRGNGVKGNIVTSAFSKGVINTTDSYGDGELVMEKAFFDEHIKPTGDFAHPRNVVVGIVMSDTVNPKIQKALDHNVVHFAHYDRIYSVTTTLEEFKNKYRAIESNVRNNTPYPIDGVVIEVLNGPIKELMGSNDHHHNWMIALKPKDEEAVAKINYINWQTGRTGKVTPVLNVEATELDGSIVRRVTAHNAKTVIDNKLCTGTKIGIIRSGGVIPKLESVYENTIEGKMYDFSPSFCPSCGSVLDWTKTHTDLICKNTAFCSAQVETKLLHFFNTIENIDGFGPATIEILVKNGYTDLTDIYNMSAFDFSDCGLGELTALNLESELQRSMKTRIEDWRFLASFGIKNLGKGNCKKLLKEFTIENVFSLDYIDLESIDGFGEIMSENILSDFNKAERDFDNLFPMFNIERTILRSDEKEIKSPISGKVVVFTGSMSYSRKVMQKEAEMLGAVIGSGVSSKTDILITGEKVGQSKITKAEKFGTKVLTEKEYNDLIG